MTVHDDISLIRTRLEAAGGQYVALEALKRIKEALPEPEPTLWEQFEEFPIGTVFQTTSESVSNYTFVKVGDDALVCVDDGRASGAIVQYYDDVLTVFAHWKDRHSQFVEIL